MNAWLYARLSNDDDPEMDSLANQMEICKEFALGQGYFIAGLSFDDNVSGMKFNRRGLEILTDAVETGQVDRIRKLALHSLHIFRMYRSRQPELPIARSGRLWSKPDLPRCELPALPG